MAAPTMISQLIGTPGWASVTAIATAMPAAPTRFPRRAVRGDDRNLSARTKQTIVIEVEQARGGVPHCDSWACRRRRLLRRLAPLEHLEHPVGDDEAADHVRRGEDHRHEPEPRRRAAPWAVCRRSGSRRRSRSRESRSSPTSAACAAASAPSRSPRCRGRSPGRGSSARRRAVRNGSFEPPVGVTQAPAVISSSQSSESSPDGARCSSRAETLRE